MVCRQCWFASLRFGSVGYSTWDQQDPICLIGSFFSLGETERDALGGFADVAERCTVYSTQKQHKLAVYLNKQRDVYQNYRLAGGSWTRVATLAAPVWIWTLPPSLQRWDRWPTATAPSFWPPLRRWSNKWLTKQKSKSKNRQAMPGKKTPFFHTTALTAKNA